MQMAFDRAQNNNLKADLKPASTVYCFNKDNIQWTYGNWSNLASVQTASQPAESNDFLFKNHSLQVSYVQPTSL